MKLIFFDTEYLSISRSKSSFSAINRYKKILFPEIFQFSFIKLNSINSFDINEKFNFYLKTKNKIPNRLIKLTHYKPLKKNILLFKNFLKVINSFFNKDFIIIVNGDDLKLLKMNLKFNDIQPLNKKVKYINLRQLLKKIYKKEFTTAELKRKFLPKSSIKLHNSLNDCFILFKVIKRIKNEIKKKEFDELINKNIKIISL
jgi:inhibitor of KinA sporulation pathway (predicted exonuclease)